VSEAVCVCAAPKLIAFERVMHGLDAVHVPDEKSDSRHMPGPERAHDGQMTD